MDDEKKWIDSPEMAESCKKCMYRIAFSYAIMSVGFDLINKLKDKNFDSDEKEMKE